MRRKHLGMNSIQSPNQMATRVLVNNSYTLAANQDDPDRLEFGIHSITRLLLRYGAVAGVYLLQF